MKLKDFLEKFITKDADINFIATVITPWQANGIDAFLLYFQRKKIDINGYVLLQKHELTGRAVDAENFCFTNPNVKFIRIDSNDKKKTLKEKIKKIAYCIKIVKQAARPKSNDPLYIVCPGDIDTTWLYKVACLHKTVEFILLDDGAGTLVGYPYQRSKLKQLFFSMVDKKIKKQSRVHRFTILDIEEGKLIRHMEVAKYYRLAFENSVANKNAKIMDYSNKVVISTQCLMENQQIFKNEDLIIYDMLFNILSEFGLNVIIKPHPRESHLERYRKYNAEIDDVSGHVVTQEEIFAKSVETPKCVIGLYSSSLANANVIFNIPVISLAKLFLQQDLSPRLRKTVSGYVKLYDGVVKFPNDEGELREMIAMIK